MDKPALAALWCPQRAKTACWAGDNRPPPLSSITFSNLEDGAGGSAGLHRNTRNKQWSRHSGAPILMLLRHCRCQQTVPPFVCYMVLDNFCSMAHVISNTTRPGNCLATVQLNKMVSTKIEFSITVKKIHPGS